MRGRHELRAEQAHVELRASILERRGEAFVSSFWVGFRIWPGSSREVVLFMMVEAFQGRRSYDRELVDNTSICDSHRRPKVAADQRIVTTVLHLIGA